MARVENLLGALALAVSDRMTGAGRRSGVSGSEQAALVTLLAQPDRTVSWLGGVLDLTSSGATRLVDRLVAADWVERSPGDDARQRRLRLTDRGRTLAREVLQARDTVLAESIRALDAGTRADLERILERVVAQLTGDLAPAFRICRLCDRSACRSAGCACPLDGLVPEEALP